MWVSAALRAAETHLLRMVQDLSYFLSPFRSILWIVFLKGLISRALRAREINPFRKTIRTNILDQLDGFKAIKQSQRNTSHCSQKQEKRNHRDHSEPLTTHVSLIVAGVKTQFSRPVHPQLPPSPS
jgi:hypothetical protein